MCIFYIREAWKESRLRLGGGMGVPKIYFDCGRLLGGAGWKFYRIEVL